jgi:hypothetical protein
LWPYQRKTGRGALSGDFCRSSGELGMLSGDKWLRRREEWATLLEECMSGPPETERSSEAKVEARGPPLGSLIVQQR